MPTLDQVQIKNLADEVDEAVQYNILGKASTLCAQIKNILKEDGLSDELVKALKQDLVELQFVRFLAITEEELLLLLSHNILTSRDIPNFDLIQRFGERFGAIIFPDDQAHFLQKCLTALEGNSELLGKNLISINGKQVSQTIGNWIALYNSIPTKNLLRGPLDAIGFVQKNANHLSDFEKLVLNDVLKIYNGSKNWLHKYDNMPELGEDEDIPEDVVLDMLYGPDESEQAKKPQVQTRAINIDGVKQANTQTQTPINNSKPSAPIATNDEVSKLSATKPEVDPQTASRLQELLHKNLSANAPAVKPATTDPIEEKLAELKKRITSEK